MRVKDVFHFCKTLTPKKLFNLFLLAGSYAMSRVLRRSVHRGMPANISVEPTSLCNLACPECPSGNGSLTRRRGNLSFSNFKTYIDPYIDTLLSCTLYFQGEPFLNPELFRMIEYLREQRVYSIISTNAHFLNEHNCERLIDSGLNRMIISLDGTDNYSYRKYRRAGSFSKVISGTDRLITLRNVMKATKPLVILQFLVFRHNQHQIGKVSALHKKLRSDLLWLKAPQIYDFSENEDLLPTVEKYRRYRKDETGEYLLKGKVPNRCWRSWQNPVITIDGEMLPCCFDKNAKHSYGSVKAGHSAWITRQPQTFRNAVLSDRKSIDICKNCTEGIRYLHRI